jgi:branched-subunit amino acid aminotransferase/4-amino-4-deoxychorismate lyase
VKVASQTRGLLRGDEPVFRADDEALLRGSAAFETLRVHDGRPFLLAEHLERWRRSAAALALPPADDVESLVAKVAEGDGVLRLYRTSHDVVVTFAPLPDGLDEERARGLRLQTFDPGPPAALEGVKATSYAAAFAARREAEADGADEALFVSGGAVLECATANIWWRTGDALFTPAVRPGVLPGVTRGFICAREPVREGEFPLAELLRADEAFVTSSIREVMPVVEVDGRRIGDGRPGPAAARLQAAIRSAA